MESRSETVSAFGVPAAFSVLGFFSLSSSKMSAALPASFLACAKAASGTALEVTATMRNRSRTSRPAVERALRHVASGECRLGFLIEDLLRARFPGFFRGLEHLLLHADDFGDLVHDINETFPLRHLIEDQSHFCNN